MPRLDQLPEGLSADHREALEWFADRAGAEIASLGQPPSGLHLANRAKDIHKPKGWRYALSIRATLSRQYDDKEPEWLPDGSWRYDYYQEGTDPAQRDEEYTNRGLVACMGDGVPVAVLRQTQGKPNVHYHVLGLAYVRGWKDGWFSLEGILGSGSHGEAAPSLSADAGNEQPFSPESITDSRKRTLATIVQRRGQATLRQALIEAYEGRCAITGCEVLDVLEAAHIHPYRREETNYPSNGLLLRGDVHTLFDLGLLTVNAATLRVVLARRIRALRSSCRSLHGARISVPHDPSQQPSGEALRWHAEHVAADGLHLEAPHQ
ncbi:HNH endonuclease [Arhodomonas sp. SL1]|uniref:HNH endonuclease n=1 Tax=Arhodomonas sp. SL1 TaxID=3425691 RepID=UPI003F885285